MKLKDKCTIQRMLGWIEGISAGLDDKLSAQLCDAVEVVDGIIDGEECEDTVGAKRGTWLFDSSRKHLVCTNGGFLPPPTKTLNGMVTSYCPNCGAEMEGDE